MKIILNRKLLFLLLIIFPLYSITVNAQSKSKKLIANNVKGYMSPVWSPDGNMIAFTTAGYKGIWVFNLKDKNIKEITDETAAGFGFKWSDNSKVILTRVAKYEGIKRYNAVKIFNIETHKSNLLTEYRTMMPGLPKFASADEKVILFGGNKLEVFESGIQSHQLKKTDHSSKTVYIRDDKIAIEDLTTNRLEIYEPVKDERVLNLQVSPDENKAAFEIIGGDMYVMNIDGSGLTSLGKGFRPRWSPDSQYIVYMISEDDGHKILSSDIYSIKIDGTEKTNLTNSDNKIEMNPDWSPDGNNIAYDVPDEGAIYIIENP